MAWIYDLKNSTDSQGVYCCPMKQKMKMWYQNLLIWFIWTRYAEANSEPYQTSMMELFANIVNGWKPVTIFAKRSFLDVCQSSEYAFDMYYHWTASKCLNRWNQSSGYILQMLSFNFTLIFRLVIEIPPSIASYLAIYNLQKNEFKSYFFSGKVKHELRVTSCEFKSTSYEFKSTSY